MLETLSIDIETFSDIDISKSGTYKYVESPNFEVLMIAYSFGINAVKNIISVENYSMQQDCIDAFKRFLQDPTIIKTAFNANFERTCLSKFFDIELDPTQWECTQVKAAMLGLPLNLDAVAKILQLPDQKDAAGKALIRYFCMPCKPTKTNGMRTRNLPEDAPDKWEAFKKYCIQDVITEQGVRSKIDFFTIPESEKQMWCLDQKINDTGILIDKSFVKTAIKLHAENLLLLTAEIKEITGLANPNSTQQLGQWLADQDVLLPDLKKDTVENMLKVLTDPKTKRALEIRQEMAKTSIKKYSKMLLGLCTDNRLRGIHQFYGANRTGRWAGRLVQPQNLPRITLKDLDVTRRVVKSGNLEMLQMLWGNVPDTLSQMIRTAFVAPVGGRFIVSDFSAIEARVISWLAGEKWRLDAFKAGIDIYEASASQMFRVPLEAITKELRQRGKVAELALGFQGAVAALIRMGALDKGLSEDELPGIVKRWRNANKKICLLWEKINRAAIDTLNRVVHDPLPCGIKMIMKRGTMYIKLPSGRYLAYFNARLKPNKYGGVSMCYDGLDQEKKIWCSTDTYGGKLVENIVQAIARDCLREKMLRLATHSFDIVMHVHDEAVIQDMQCEEGSVELVNHIMGSPIHWAPGLPMGAATYASTYYKKD